MSLKKLVYSVLIVSAAEGFNNAISALLPESKYSPVHFVSNISAPSEHSPSMLLIMLSLTRLYLMMLVRVLQLIWEIQKKPLFY